MLELCLSDEIIPDLNNIVRAIEDEGDRCYFGSTNDADRLREIANWLNTNFRRTPPTSQSDDPWLTPEEEAELVELINGNWYLQPNPPSQNDEALVEDIAIAMLNLQGFHFATDPMEYGQNAYEITQEAIMDARAILPILKREVAKAKAHAEMLAGALEQSQLGLTVLADMLKRVGLERGEQVAVQMHRDNTAALATYQEKN